MPKLNDLTGKTFGQWYVESRAGSTSNNAAIWKCRCLLCGSTKNVVGYSLTQGKSTKCRSCVPRATLKKDGRDTRLYHIYTTMKQRCLNPNSSSYRNYGGRGILICDEWATSFDNFQAWAIQNGYSDSLTIDRIDINGNYSPTNCRWISNFEQQSNKRSNLFIVYNGTKTTLTNACRLANISVRAVRSRLYSKKCTPQEAFDYYL